MDREAWWATLVHGVPKSRTRLSNFTHSLTQSLFATNHFLYLNLGWMFLLLSSFCYLFRYSDDFGFKKNLKSIFRQICIK